jgi:catechol 2,3-dioxygenase-like lactoylglutathione lyase family enzyme
VTISLVSLVVADYDEAIGFFVDVLGFELVEDSPALTTRDGRPKRWVVVRPPDGGTGLLLAQADGPDQEAVVGRQTGGRVGFFLQVRDFDAMYGRMRAAGVCFHGGPRTESYGQVVVFEDVAGNRWDLLGPRPGGSAQAVALAQVLVGPGKGEVAQVVDKGDLEGRQART